MPPPKGKSSAPPLKSQADPVSGGLVVLTSKTCKPAIRKEFVRRQALIERLEANALLPLTLISAATGYGKSVTASQWLEQTHYNYGWLSLDEEHNDFQVFITYLATILKKQWPRQSFDIESLLQGNPLPAKLITSIFINDLDQLEDHFVLVLDDYQVIREAKIHEFITSILSHPPKHFHLVILTQRDPPLRLARLRAQFRLNEVRMDDLAFTSREARMLRSSISAETSDQQVQTLVETADGWITGITAGLMGLARGVAMEKVIHALHGGGSVISELLNEVVLQGLPVSMQKFLGLTAILDRFSEGMVSKMAATLKDPDLPEDEISQLFERSRAQNLFLIQLDSADEWFRYHHLFRSQIKHLTGNHFKKESVQKLFKEASLYSNAHDSLEEALKYAILTEDMVFAVSLFEKKRIALHNAEQFQRLERLIRMFPEDAIMRTPELLLSLAILQDHKANYQAMKKYLEHAGQILDRQNPEAPEFKQLKGQYHGVSTYLPFMQGDYQASIRHSEIALDLLPASEPNYFREFALAYYALGHQAVGETDIGLREISKTFDGPLKNDNYFRGRLLYLKILIHAMCGDAKELMRLGAQLQAKHSPKDHPSAWMMGIYALVSSLYISNKLHKVHQCHEELIRYRFSGRPFGVVHHFFVECLASVALGRWEDVEAGLRNCKEFAADLHIAPLDGIVHAFEVELALRQNDITRAVEVSALANFNPHPPIWYYYIAQLTEVKLLFLTNEEEKGFRVLEELIGIGKKSNNQNLMIQALALKAVMLEKSGDQQPALSALSEALSLSKNKEQIRTFLDHGDLMRHLLQMLPKEQVEVSQIEELEQAFSEGNPQKTDNPKGNYDSLSSRELEVLALVSQGYKNDSIADKLFVSVDTVKKHLYNAYQKLYVNNRISAVRKARELGLIASR